MIEAMPLDVLLSEWRPGSRDDNWTWQQEHDQLWDDWSCPAFAPATRALADEIDADGIQEPILLGDDGRVWDGHHRIVVAMRLGITAVPVERA